MNKGSSIEVGARSLLRSKNIQARGTFSICIVHICYLQYLEFSISTKPQLLRLSWVRLFRRRYANRKHKKGKDYHRHREIKTQLLSGHLITVTVSTVRHVEFKRNFKIEAGRELRTYREIGGRHCVFSPLRLAVYTEELTISFLF